MRNIFNIISNNNNKTILSNHIVIYQMFILFIPIFTMVLMFLKRYFINFNIIFQHKYIINNLQITQMIHYINIQALFVQIKSFLHEYLHQYLALNLIIYLTFFVIKNTKIIAILREYLCYRNTLNSWKTFKICSKSIKCNLLRTFKKFILTFKSHFTNINVIQSRFKKLHGSQFRKSKSIINKSIFIILYIKNIIYPLLSHFC